MITSWCSFRRTQDCGFLPRSPADRVSQSGEAASVAFAEWLPLLVLERDRGNNRHTQEWRGNKRLTRIQTVRQKIGRSLQVYKWIYDNQRKKKQSQNWAPTKKVVWECTYDRMIYSTAMALLSPNGLTTHSVAGKDRLHSIAFSNELASALPSHDFLLTWM